MNFNRLSALGVALMLQIVALSANASDISGITPVQSGGANIYNIDPAKINSSGIGFRKYGKFDLSEGDAANFMMNGVSKFVNLVDSKVSINGLVNTVNSDLSKSNGGLVFISPEGFVVGATGVLNVGSLSVYTPDSASYNKYSTELADSIANGTDFNLNLTPGSITYGNGVITIDGSLISSGEINLNSKAINIGKGANVVSGINTQKTFMSNNSETGKLEYTKPEDIFYTLVNTSAMSGESSNINLETNGGNLVIGGLVDSRNGDINITVKDGNIVNAGSTDILLASSGNLNVTVTGSGTGSFGEVPTGSTRDLTKSINVQIGGNVNIDADNAVNLASIDKNLNVDTINAGDVVYLTVDKTPSFAGTPGIYSSSNHTKGAANVNAGGNISIYSSGDIGSKTNGGRFTISSTSDTQNFNTESWNTDKFNYNPSGNGIEIVSKTGDIYLKDNDKSANIKNITAQKGSVDAEFVGKTYIENVSATDKVKVLTQGDVLYVKNLDNTDITEDVYIKNPVTGIMEYVPPTILEADNVRGATFTALGLGENFENSSDSIIILKNGTVQGSTGSGGYNIEFMADNVYADGMHAALSKDKTGNAALGSTVNFEGVTVVSDDNTASIEIPGTRNIRKDNRYVNITYSAVTEDAVNGVESAEGSRVYYKSENGQDSETRGKMFPYYSYGNSNNNADAVIENDAFGDTDDDSDIDEPNIDLGDTDDDSDLDQPITGDSDDDTDPDKGNEGEITDPTEPTEPDNPNIGDNDTDDDIDTPPVTGDTDDDEGDIPGIGDNDTDDDIDNPPVGDTDDDDDDIPGTKPPVNPGQDPESPIPSQDTINTEPPKPLSVVPEVGTNNVTPEEDIENENPVNTNGLFLDTDTDTDYDIDTHINNNKNGLTKKKRKFFFRYRFR